MTLGKKRWIVAGVLAILAISAYAANPFADARASVRLVTGGPNTGSCSAVVIAPNQALTAKHCDNITDMLVDGKPAKIVWSSPTEDVMSLSVPGLECPCAPVSTVRPALDETLLFIGWLYGDFKMTTRGEYLGRVQDEGLNYGVGVAPTGPGMSGGGVFRVFVTGDIPLVGIISAKSVDGGAVRYVEVSKDALRW